MNHQTQPITDEELSAYIDDQLDTERRQLVETWLEQNPTEASRLRQLQHLDSLLQHRHKKILNEPIPDSLTLGDINTSRFSFSKPLFAAASIAWLSVGIAIGWMFQVNYPAKQDLSITLMRPAVVAHATYLPEVVHPVEVRADQEAHLTKWLSKRLGSNVTAPSLIEHGYELMGGRLLPGDPDPAAQFMYENSYGSRLTLYVSAKKQSSSDTAFKYAKESGISNFYWIDGNLGYALSGKIDKLALLDLATTVYRGLTK